MNEPAGDDWFPARVYREATRGTWRVDWCRLGDDRFTDPFFHETVRRLERRPFNLAFRPQTELADLRDDDPRALEPSCFIFHLSRCGSTLVAQTFAARADTIVLSEAGPIDDVLRAARYDAGVSDEWRIGRLRAIVGALGRRRNPLERHLVVKMDAWHTLDLAIVARAYPNVPWFFVYRDPIAVLVSQIRMPGWFLSAVNVPNILGMDLGSVLSLATEERYARVLARICEAVLDHGVSPQQLIDYDADLHQAIQGRIAPALGIALGPRELAVMERSAKEPDRIFVPDSDAKRRDATVAIREAAQRFAAGPYHRLDGIRSRGQDSMSFVDLPMP